jgi:hypothetical protein
MERLFKWLLVLVLAVGVAGCGGGDTADDGAGDSGAGETAGEAGDTAGDTGGEEAAVSPVDPATAGSVSGSVMFTGTAPEMETIDMSGEPDCAAKYTEPPTAETVVVNDNGTLANVLVYVKDGLGEMTFPVPTEPVKLDQVGCHYVPHVVALQTDQTLLVTNSDDLLHNIHPEPAENRPFNESQPTAGMEFEKTFGQAELSIPVGCDVHDWMSAWIHVLDHPYFAVTGPDGSFDLPNLPPGDYTIAALHEEYGEQTQQVTVGASEAVTAEFSFAGN